MKAIALIAAAVAAALLAAEGLLRALDYNSPQWVRRDPDLGWALRPGAQGWFTHEGRAFVTVNRAGQRDRERTLDKPEGVYRIAVLGDMYSEAMHVPLAQTYWWQLGERLQACGFQPGKRIEVLNFGVRGYGTAQAYVMLEARALRYRPDLVLLQFTNGSDVRDNSRALDPIKGRPYYTVDARGVPRLDDSFASSPAHLSRASIGKEVVHRLADRWRALQYARNTATEVQVIGRAHAGSPPDEVGLEPDVLADPREPAWQEAWRVTEALLASMRDLASRNGAALAVFTVPYAVAVHPDAALRGRVQAKYGVPDLAYPDRRVAAFARANGMLGITLVEGMQERATASGQALYGFDNYRPGFGHWNALGHRAAAEIIAQSLCAVRLSATAG
jgi:hypothetical protein